MTHQHDDIEKTERKRNFRKSLHARSVMLDDDRYEKVYEIGNGNFSEGMRRCIDAYNKEPQ